MLCAACGAPADAAPCGACGAAPRLDGRYQLSEVLGQGAQGTTFSATGPDGAVAIKELPVGRGADPGQLARLQREAVILGQLSHPAIPRLRETFFSGEGRARCLYVVQDQVEGVDLERWNDGHRTSEAEVVALLLELCDVLGWLHDRSPPVLHRDLKPANVIRTPDGALRLVDFGSVRAALRDPDLGGSTVAGTFGYMAPEQMVGDASPRSDLYSLGALAVRLLTRQQPASLLDRSGKMQWRAHARVGAGLAALLDDLLATEPAARPRSAGAVADRLRAIERGEAPTEPPALEPERLPVEAVAAGPRPVLERAPDAQAERVADLLQRGLERDGQLVPTAGGWQWVDLSGRVAVDLDGDRIAARPRFQAAPIVAAVALAALFMAVAGGGAIWALVAGALVAKKAVSLAMMAVVLGVAGAAGPVMADLGRRRHHR
jgi:serine/threonine protein kinase